MYLLYYVCTYVLYRLVPYILVIGVFSSTYDHVYHVFVCGRDSVHTRTFSRNIQARDSVHAHHFIRNVRACDYEIFGARDVCARTYTIFRGCASSIILDHTSACLCICARAPTSIFDYGGCSRCLSVIMPNTLLWGDLGHGSSTAHVYIQGDIGDSLYHILESPERCSLQWLDE